MSDSLLHMIQQLPRPPCTITSAPGSLLHRLQAGSAAAPPSNLSPDLHGLVPVKCAQMSEQQANTLQPKTRTLIQRRHRLSPKHTSKRASQRKPTGFWRPEPPRAGAPVPAEGKPTAALGPTDKHRSYLRTRTMKLTPPKSVVVSRDAAQQHTLVAG